MQLVAFFSLLYFSFNSVFALCPVGSVGWQNSCYSFQSNSTSFTNAEIVCENLNGHLTSIHNGFTNALIAGQASDKFHESTVSDFWIGFNSLIIPGNWSWMDNSAIDYKNWGPSEPKNLSTNCAAENIQTGVWSSDDCFKQKPFVCEIPQNLATTTPILSTTKSYPAYENCSHGWSYFEPTHSCYGNDIIGYRIYNWTSAEQSCLNQNAHLVSLHSSEEAIFVSALVDFTSQGTWTGLYSNDSEVTWHWSDGSPVDYLPWYSGYPNRKASSCACLSDEHIFDFPCQSIYLAVCKRLAPIYF